MVDRNGHLLKVGDLVDVQAGWVCGGQGRIMKFWDDDSRAAVKSIADDGWIAWCAPPELDLLVAPFATLLITPDGRIRFVYDDQLAGLFSHGAAAVIRASHVEPEIHPTVGSPTWTADLSPSGGPRFIGFATRAAALEKEKRWLEENL